MGICLTSNTEDCRTCYKCIRNCPIKAISFEDNRASIIQDKCILCGTCYNVCPQHLKTIRNDVAKVKRFLADNDVIASVAPSFISYYEHSDMACLRETLKKLGFKDAEETAIGATIVKKAYDDLLNNGRDLLISSCCHSINTLIQKHYQECLPYLAPVLSPMQAHGQDIKRRYGSAVKVVFIGPCIAKKDESDRSHYVEAALTFEELDGWLKEAGIPMAVTGETDGIEESKARLFPEDGGILKTMERSCDSVDYIVVSGVRNAVSTLEDIRSGAIRNCFIEMSACAGSCVNGPVSRKDISVAARTMRVNAYAGKKDFVISNESVEAAARSFSPKQKEAFHFTEAQIEDMLAKMNKADEADRLNCGCCGYDTCVDKAAAILAGRANITMCLPLLMEKSHSLAENLVNSTPNGLMALDENLEIQLINLPFCRLIGIHEPKEVIGSHIAMVMDPSDFYEVMDGGRVFAKREYLSETDRYIAKTITFDEKYGLFVCVVRDITETEKADQAHRKLVENTIAITDTLLEKNMRSVHEIASLLGETTAETKVALERLKGLVKTDE